MDTSHLIPLSFHDQIELLKSRRMLFDNEERAEKYLAYIGYHRLSVYWNNFYHDVSSRDYFVSSPKFEDVLDLYIFDRKLRVLFFEASERIEVCLKVLVSDALCMQKSDSFWYKDPEYFNSRIDKYYVNEEPNKELCDHEWVLKKINESLSKIKKNENTLKKFVDIQQTPIPSWELVNILTFGCFSNIMSLVKGDKLQPVYARFGLPKKILDNWLECVVSVRNICAHYGLLYRRSFSMAPMSLSRSKNRKISMDFENCKKTLFAQLSVFNYLLMKISPTSSWTKRVLSLIEEHINNPLLSYRIMGFPENWEGFPSIDE